MSLFTKIDGAAIVRNRGVYRSCDLYEMHSSQSLFAKVGSGFIKLNPRGHTSSPSAKWDQIVGCAFHQDALNLWRVE